MCTILMISRGTGVVTHNFHPSFQLSALKSSLRMGMIDTTRDVGAYCPSHRFRASSVALVRQDRWES